MRNEAEAMIARLGARIPSVSQLTGQLSGGQQQSVAIARALTFNPKLVIMDEPTAALGVSQTALVLDIIEQLASRGIAVLVISHNLTDVMNVADRIAVLYLGRLAAVGPISQFDTQSIVELMTTGTSGRAGAAPGGPAYAGTQSRPGSGATATGNVPGDSTGDSYPGEAQ
jgi:ABC-type sugar transport system ATPase subunit